MSRKSSASPPLRPRTELLEPLPTARAKIEDRVAKGRELRATRVENAIALQILKDDHRLWKDYNETLLGGMFSTDELRTQYATRVPSPMIHTEGPTFGQTLRWEMEELDAEIGTLESILARLELFSPRADSGGLAPEATSVSADRDLQRAFVVHGHDTGTRDAVARLLRELGIEPIVLFEQPSGGRTVIEKLEHYSNVGFAIVLLTPDDEGRAKGSTDLQARARQNVVLELGYFIGKLARKRVCPLYKGALELPSDYHGVVYIQLDDGGAWKYKLADEMKVAGYTIDKNKIS